VVYVRDGRGWYYRYSHLHTIDEAIQPGVRVKMGQRIGLLGKEGGSGGWTHLHFDVSAVQPSGRYGIVEGYAFVWQVYHDEHKTALQAVARPHHLSWSGGSVTLDATRSFSRQGPGGIAQYRWTFTDGTTASGAKVERRYDKPGEYSEILEVMDGEGRMDYDFARVLVIDREHPDQLPPAIHAVYYPTFGIRAGDEVTFKVRSFSIGPEEGREQWDFGDGSPSATTQSDGNAVKLAKDGYAVTRHRYDRPGHYLVRVERSNDAGVTAVGHVQVRVGTKD
jgi:PKD repeat protein